MTSIKEAAIHIVRATRAIEIVLDIIFFIVIVLLRIDFRLSALPTPSHEEAVFLSEHRVR